MKYKIQKITLSLLCLFVTVGGVLAAIDETVKITGTTFNIGTTFGDGGNQGGGETNNTALKILVNPSASPSGSNLKDSIAGPTYNNVNDVWSNIYAVKVFNVSDTLLNLVANAEYVSDPDTLRDDIYVGIHEWNDADADGVFDEGEKGQTYGNDTILRLRNDTFSLGNINPGQTKALIYEFSGGGLSEANAGKSAVYDFTIECIAQ